jgi:nucleotide-binding universal stress UspA family protein
MGVDAADEFKPVLYLLNALGFPQAHLTLVHAANPQWTYTPALPVDPMVITDLTTEVENVGRRALDEARDVACRIGLPTKSMLTFGSPAEVLTKEAEAEHADLIAVCATHHGMWSTSFLGSVSRVLTTSSPVSCLVAKGGPKLAKPNFTRPLKAVFATDHSAFSERCLEWFLKAKPEGIGAIHVVSAYDLTDYEEDTLNRNLPVLGGNVVEWVEETVEANNRRVADRLEQVGYKVTHEAVRGRPDDALREAMQDSHADLMIVGAQGKGFLERALIGSVSLHQVVSEPYPVLVIRP